MAGAWPLPRPSQTPGGLRALRRPEQTQACQFHGQQRERHPGARRRCHCRAAQGRVPVWGRGLGPGAGGVSRSCAQRLPSPVWPTSAGAVSHAGALQPSTPETGRAPTAGCRVDGPATATPPSLSEVRRAWWTSAVRAQPAMDGPCCRGAGPRWPGGRQGASPWRPRAEMVRLWAARGGRRPRGRRQFPLPCRWPVRRRCQPCTTFCSGPSRVRKVPPAGLGVGGTWGGRRVPVGSP